MSDEESVRVCQAEIRRLRRIVREYAALIKEACNLDFDKLFELWGNFKDLEAAKLLSATSLGRLTLSHLSRFALAMNRPCKISRRANMPNWCENRLQAVGCRKDLDAFLAECFSKDKDERVFLDFEKVVPLGEPGEDWYDKRLDNWGTKWNVSDCDIKRDDSSITVWFETAWSPPIPIMEALTKKYPTLSIKLEYSEGGMCFRGIFEGQNGEVTQDDFWDMTREDMIELGYLDADEDEETA